LRSESLVSLTKVQNELIRIAEAFTAPPGPEPDPGEGERYDITCEGDWTIDSAHTARGLGYLAEQLLRSRFEGSFPIRRNHEPWGVLEITANRWVIRGPGGYTDARTAEWDDRHVDAIPAKGPDEPGP
jgi:hypothetical protein